MTYTPGPRPKKGQMKCFKCRASCLSKDGEWQNLEHQQVFLCKICIRLPQETLKRDLASMK
jgi:hypothetical protein